MAECATPQVGLTVEIATRSANHVADPGANGASREVRGRTATNVDVARCPEWSVGSGHGLAWFRRDLG